MTKTSFVALLCLTYFALSHCDDEANTKLTDAANCFTLNFYKQQTVGKSNVVSSPFSADVLLSMLLLGSRGNTAKQLSNALGYDGLSVRDMKKAFRSQLRKMRSSNGNTLDIATSLWIQRNFQVPPKFKRAVTRNFNSRQYEVDFRTNSPGATGEINVWANQSTNGVIPKIFDKNLDPATVLVLANAMYFNGTWENQFDTDSTQNGQFLNNDNQDSSSSVPLMHQQAYFKYKIDSGLNAQVLEMQYVGGDMSMIVLLPGRGSNLDNLENSLTCDTFKSGIMSLGWKKVDVTIPKYEIASVFDLVGPMKAVGIEDIFADSANLSGISQNIKVSKAVQKCVVKVNEAGSEAAVVTSIGVMYRSMRRYEEVVPFVANRPFLFLILDKRTNIVLFIGRVKELPSS